MKRKLKKLQYVKTRKISISKFHFPVKLYEIQKKVMIQNQQSLQILSDTVSHKTYIIFRLHLKKYD